MSAVIAELLESDFDLVPAEIWVQSDLPHGRGFSSSAAFTLGLIDSLTRLSGPLLEQQAALLMLFVTASLLGGDVSTKADGQCLHLAITLPVLPASGD